MSRKKYEFIITNKLTINRFDSIVKNDLFDDLWISSKYSVDFKNLRQLSCNISVSATAIAPNVLFNDSDSDNYIYLDGFDIGFDIIGMR